MIPQYSQTLIKEINRARILNHLRCSENSSRAALAEETGLDRKTITNLVTELLEEEWIQESGEKQEGRGRPRVQLEIKPGRMAIGIDIQPGYLTGALTDARGRIHQIETFPLAAPPKPEDLVRGVKRLRESLSRKHPPLGTGVVIPAAIEAENGFILEASNFPDLNNVELRSLLKKELPGPVSFENSSKASALAEKWFGACRDLSDFVALELGWGIGAGLIIDGKLYKGAGQLAGEIGHVCIKPGGRRCACGSRGCLEAYLGRTALTAELQAVNTPFDGDQPLGQPGQKVIEKAGKRLGLGLAAVVNLLSPSAIILGGEITRHHQILFPALEATLDAQCITAQRKRVGLRRSPLAHAPCLGASSLVFSSVFEVPGFYHV
ncbi:MAG: ROK family protein [Planctomycetota bacterium]|jgi:predicted NBD/HSP70 family sugar kinase